MADRLGGVPVAPEVNALECEIGCNEETLAGRNSKNRAVIAYPGDNVRSSEFSSRAVAASRQPSNLMNQGSFGKRHGPNIPPESCPMVTSDCRSSVTCLPLCVVDTGNPVCYR